MVNKRHTTILIFSAYVIGLILLMVSIRNHKNPSPFILGYAAFLPGIVVGMTMWLDRENKRSS